MRTLLIMKNLYLVYPTKEGGATIFQHMTHSMMTEVGIVTKNNFQELNMDEHVDDWIKPLVFTCQWEALALRSANMNHSQWHLHVFIFIAYLQTWNNDIFWTLLGTDEGNYYEGFAFQWHFATEISFPFKQLPHWEQTDRQTLRCSSFTLKHLLTCPDLERMSAFHYCCTAEGISYWKPLPWLLVWSRITIPQPPSHWHQVDPLITPLIYRLAGVRQIRASSKHLSLSQLMTRELSCPTLILG